MGRLIPLFSADKTAGAEDLAQEDPGAAVRPWLDLLTLEKETLVRAQVS